MINRVQRGKPIQASTFNQLGSLAGQFQATPRVSSAQAQQPLPGSGEAVICCGYNSGDETLEVYQVAMIRGQVQVAGARNTLLEVSQMENGDSLDLVVIALDEVAPNAVGRFCIAGICWAQATGTGIYASPQPGSGIMTRSTNGLARVLAEDSGLILIRIAGGGGTNINQNVTSLTGAFVVPVGCAAP